MIRKSYFQFILQTRKFYKANSKLKTTEGSLLGIGNPIIDYIVKLDQKEYEEINKTFKFKKNVPQIMKESQAHIFDIIKDSSYNAFVTAGGATQNTIRIAQWLLQCPHSTTFIGSVGDDEEGNILKNILEKQNVYVNYQKCSNKKTGKCLILVSGKDRTLISDFGASVYLNPLALDDKLNSERFDMAKYVYLEGFLWLTNPILINEIITKVKTGNKILVTNLHAEFIAPFLIDSEKNFLENVDILFGNQSEALFLAKAIAMRSHSIHLREKFSEFLNFPILGTDSLARFALLLSQLSKSSQNNPKLIIFTQGSNEVILCKNGVDVDVIPVPILNSSIINDKVGCGDSFVGGFLAALISGRDPAEAVYVGIKTSQHILTKSGCYISDDKPIIDLT